jgi:hypothetical protein
VDFGDAVIANMTVSNSERALLITDSCNLSFQNVEFKGGMVRFEKSENVTFEGNIFNDNLGKGGYAGSVAKIFALSKTLLIQLKTAVLT